MKKIDFQQRINELAKKYNNKKIVIYGGGVLFSTAMQYYDFSKLNIIGIADKKFKNKDETLEGYQAIPSKHSVKNRSRCCTNCDFQC